MIRISHFNTFPYGGAAVAARRLNQHLGELGYDSTFYYRRQDRDTTAPDEQRSVKLAPMIDSPVPGKLAIFRRRKQKARLREIYRLHNDHIAARPTQAETFSMARLPETEKLDWSQIKSDIVHLHWVSFFVDYTRFFRTVPVDVPLVFTLHDMNGFTGGCHYSGGCQRFTLGCGNCPQVEKSAADDVSQDSFLAKKQGLAGRQVHVAAPSKWMLDLARQSDVWPKETTFHHMRLCFDLQQYRPIERRKARRQLGIQSDAILIGFGADDVRNQRKGVGALLQSLKLLKSKERVEGLVYGSGGLDSDPDLPKLHQMGFVDSPEKQRLIYSAADLFVVPSTEDNQPQVGLEAMACGTPLVAFDTCGIPEMVQHAKTGLLARSGDSQSLAEQLDRMIDNSDERTHMGQCARQYMQDFHNGTARARDYANLYQTALSQIRDRRAAS